MRKILLLISFFFLLFFIKGEYNSSFAQCIPNGGSGCNRSGSTNCCDASATCQGAGLGTRCVAPADPEPSCISTGDSCSLGGTSCCDASATCEGAGLGRRCTIPPVTPACISTGGTCSPGGTSCCDASATCQGAGLGYRCTTPVVTPACIPNGQQCNLGGISCCDTSATCAGAGLGSRCTPSASSTQECTPDNAREKCFSGECQANGKCRMGVTAIACEQDTRNGITNFVCNTAIGRISTSPDRFAQSVLRLFLGLAGGILLLLIIINGYKLMTSQGDPEKIKDGREGIIAAIAGILLIIFSLAILRLITVDILGIPGFG